MKPILSVKDHSVSGEIFQLLYDSDLDLLKTDPQPSPENMGRYYESDDYISHTDSKRSWFERTYQIIKARALKNKISLVNEWHPVKGHLLDYGSGTGDFLVAANKDGWQITAFEPNVSAKSLSEKKGIQTIESTEALPNHTFDVISLWHVLEHVHDVNARLLEFKRLLKPDGTLIIAVPNFKSFDAKHYGKFWAAYDVPRHLWHFSKKSIAILAQRSGLKLVSVKPMVFDAFYVSLLSEKYKTGTMNPIRALIIGLKSNLKARKSREFSSHIYIIKNS